ncbi:hypothetical protein B7P43_G08404 [Cryptotermes secundus]|uniref:Uncharacterized protein n=1 Tax=Cryptotermes secundus TaxID=105785 RepID=A0A2J7PXG8_9NEOP|nr:hypothetical protein B7P43_G08404 [Cryptotermes secundus]
MQTLSSYLECVRTYCFIIVSLDFVMLTPVFVRTGIHQLVQQCIAEEPGFDIWAKRFSSSHHPDEATQPPVQLV